MPKKIYLSEVMMPSQTNPSGNVHGGELMKMMDSTVYAAARDLETSAPRKEQFEVVLTAKLDDFQIGITVGGKKIDIFKMPEDGDLVANAIYSGLVRNM